MIRKQLYHINSIASFVLITDLFLNAPALYSEQNRSLFFGSSFRSDYVSMRKMKSDSQGPAPIHCRRREPMLYTGGEWSTVSHKNNSNPRTENEEDTDVTLDQTELNFFTRVNVLYSRGDGAEDYCPSGFGSDQVQPYIESFFASYDTCSGDTECSLQSGVIQNHKELKPFLLHPGSSTGFFANFSVKKQAWIRVGLAYLPDIDGSTFNSGPADDVAGPLISPSIMAEKEKQLQRSELATSFGVDAVFRMSDFYFFLHYSIHPVKDSPVTFGNNARRLSYIEYQGIGSTYKVGHKDSGFAYSLVIYKSTGKYHVIYRTLDYEGAAVKGLLLKTELAITYKSFMFFTNLTLPESSRKSPGGVETENETTGFIDPGGYLNYRSEIFRNTLSFYNSPTICRHDHCTNVISYSNSYNNYHSHAGVFETGIEFNQPLVRLKFHASIFRPLGEKTDNRGNPFRTLKKSSDEREFAAIEFRASYSVRGNFIQISYGQLYEKAPEGKYSKAGEYWETGYTWYFNNQMQNPGANNG